MMPTSSKSVFSAGLGLLCLLAYAPLWSNDFIDLDDAKYLTTNDQVRNGLTANGIAWAWTTYHAGFWFPLTWMSFQFDGTLSRLFGVDTGLSPSVFHAQNLFWHTASTVLLFLVLVRMTARVWLSAMTAALFAVHPLHVESVAWATERKDVLSAFFWMLTLFSYVRYTERPSARRYALVMLPFVLGLLSKPILVTLPCALLLLDYWPLRRYSRKNVGDAEAPAAPRPAAAGIRWIILEKVPLFLLAAGAAVLTVKTQLGEGATIPLAALPISSRVANAATSCAWYLEKTFWPSNLAIFYMHPMNEWIWPPVLAAMTLLALISVLALARARSAPWMLIGWLWFLVTLAPVIGFVQVGAQSRADRFVYIPHVGLFIAIVWSAAALLDRLNVGQAARGALAGACLVALTSTTMIQTGYWENTESIWTHTLDATANNHRAHVNLGVYHLEGFRESGNRDHIEEARKHFQEAVRIKPEIPEYQYDLGVSLLMRGDLDEAGEHFRAALRDPQPHAGGMIDRANALHNLGLVEHWRKNYPEAARIFRKALEESSQADTHAELGKVLWVLGQRDEAKAQWESALAADGDFFDALEGMGLFHLQQGNNAEAARYFEKAVSANPNQARTWSELGIACGRLQRWEQAVSAHDQAVKSAVAILPPGPELAIYLRHYAYALRFVDRIFEAEGAYAECTKMDPTWRLNNLTRAWNLATAMEITRGDAATAFELANEACQTTESPSAHDLDVAAASLAALGRFDEAVTICTKALALADQAGPIQERLALYERKKRYVLTSDKVTK